MKSIKPILISIAVIVVVLIAMVILIYVVPETTETEEDTTETTEETTTTSETVYIVNENYEDLVSFDILPTEGTDIHVDVNVTDDGYEFDVEPASTFFDYDSSMLRSMTYTVTSMSAKSVVDDDDPDLAAYGLDEPWHTVRTTYSDGHVVEIYLGNQTPVDSNYYCMSNLSDDIYVLGSYMVSLLTRTDLDYRAITLFPTYTDDDIYSNIDWIKITERDGTEIELVLDEDQTNEYNVTSSLYVMLQPQQGSGNDTIIESDLMDIVATVEASDILCDITEDEYKDYGFDDPVRLEMTDVSGNSLDLLIGDVCPNDSYTYVMVNGSDTVLSCPTSALTWQNINYYDLMIRTVWSCSITNVASIDYELDGVTHSLQMEHYVTQNANGNDTDGINATLDGQEILETNARRLFVRTLNFRAIGDASTDDVEGIEPLGTVTITMLDGTSNTMELYPLNDRQYAVSIDGVIQSYCYKKNYNTLVEAIDLVLSGEELDFSFDS
jgi:hypothetical protein